MMEDSPQKYVSIERQSNSDINFDIYAVQVFNQVLDL